MPESRKTRSSRDLGKESQLEPGFGAFRVSVAFFSGFQVDTHEVEEPMLSVEMILTSVLVVLLFWNKSLSMDQVHRRHPKNQHLVLEQQSTCSDLSRLKSSLLGRICYPKWEPNAFPTDSMNPRLQHGAGR